MKRENEGPIDEEKAIWTALISSIVSLIIAALLLLQKLTGKTCSASTFQSTQFDLAAVTKQLKQLQEKKVCCSCGKQSDNVQDDSNQNLISALTSLITTALAWLQKMNTNVPPKQGDGPKQPPCNALALPKKVPDEDVDSDYVLDITQEPFAQQPSTSSHKNETPFQVALDHLSQVDTDDPFGDQYYRGIKPLPFKLSQVTEESQTYLSYIKQGDEHFKCLDYGEFADVNAANVNELIVVPPPAENAMQTEDPEMKDAIVQYSKTELIDRWTITEEQKKKVQSTSTDPIQKVQNVQVSPSCKCVGEQKSAPKVTDVGIQKSKHDVKIFDGPYTIETQFEYNKEEAQDVVDYYNAQYEYMDPQQEYPPELEENVFLGEAEYYTSPEILPGYASQEEYGQPEQPAKCPFPERCRPTQTLLAQEVLRKKYMGAAKPSYTTKYKPQVRFQISTNSNYGSYRRPTYVCYPPTPSERYSKHVTRIPCPFYPSAVPKYKLEIKKPQPPPVATKSSSLLDLLEDCSCQDDPRQINES